MPSTCALSLQSLFIVLATGLLFTILTVEGGDGISADLNHSGNGTELPPGEEDGLPMLSCGG